MSYTDFSERFLIACYRLASENSEILRSGEVLDEYDLEPNDGWVYRVLEAWRAKGLIRGKGTMGSETEQPIFLTGEGFEQAERLLARGVRVPRRRLQVVVSPATGEPVLQVSTDQTDLPENVRVIDTSLPVLASEKADVRVDSSSWTGLPTGFEIDAVRRDTLIAAISSAERQLDELGASNHEKAQARAYIVAIRALAEAPEPPADLIWELANRANSLAGIASLFVSIIALFT